jgi:hypothetical protein
MAVISWRAKPAATRPLQWFTKAISSFLCSSALRAAHILAAWAGHPIQNEIRGAIGNKVDKLMRHIRKVEAESHAWKHRYKAETGSLRGRIRQLEKQLAERRNEGQL